MENDIKINLQRVQKVFNHFFVYHTDFNRDLESVENEIAYQVQKEMKTIYLIESAVSACINETFDKYTLKHNNTKQQVVEYLTVLYKRIIETTYKKLYPTSML